MLILTDRISDAKRIQKVLQQVRPCAVAAIHQAFAQPAVFSTIVCDVKLDSAQSLEVVKAALVRHRINADIPVLFLLRDPSRLTQEQARLAGATFTLPYPIPSEQLLEAVRRLGTPGAAANDTQATAVASAAAAEGTVAILADAFGASARQRPIQLAQVERGGDLLLQAIKQVKVQSWLDVVYRYDDTTYQHCLLVAGLTAAFALELGLQPQAQRLLVQAALVHDIGKAHIPHHILNKPGQLTAAEMAVMRMHASIGFDLLRRQTDVNPVLLDVIRHHHEFLDGSGYPDRLYGDQISRPVRMSTICDIYSALVERRPYKAPHPPEAALARLDALGPKLDRALFQAFRGVVADRTQVLATGT